MQFSAGLYFPRCSFVFDSSKDGGRDGKLPVTCSRGFASSFTDTHESAEVKEKELNKLKQESDQLVLNQHPASDKIEVSFMRFLLLSRKSDTFQKIRLPKKQERLYE